MAASAAAAVVVSLSSDSLHIDASGISEEEQQLRQVTKKIKLICQNIPKDAINLSCGHVASQKELLSRCKTCHAFVHKHSDAFALRAIVDIMNSIDENTPIEILQQSMENVRKSLLDAATLELFDQAVNLKCGHTINLSTYDSLLSRANQAYTMPSCPHCRAYIGDARLSPALILKEIVNIFSEISAREEVVAAHAAIDPDALIREPLQTVDRAIHDLHDYRTVQLQTLKTLIQQIHQNIRNLEERDIADARMVEELKRNFQTLLNTVQAALQDGQFQPLFNLLNALENLQEPINRAEAEALHIAENPAEALEENHPNVAADVPNNILANHSHLWRNVIVILGIISALAGTFIILANIFGLEVVLHTLYIIGKIIFIFLCLATFTPSP